MRLFVSIEPDEGTLAALFDARDALARSFGRAVRPSADSQIHLTVKFLGEVEPARLDDAVAALDLACEPLSAFETGLDRLGAFPEKGPVRIVWAGLSDPSGGLMDCYRSVEGALAAAGFPREERSFVPHITLARVKDDHLSNRIRRYLEGESLPEIRQTVCRISLKESILRREGAEHSTVKEFLFNHGPSAALP